MRDLICLVAHQLNERANLNVVPERYNNKWVFAIYKSLLLSNLDDKSRLEWESKHNQWKIDHNYRAQKTAAQRSNASIGEFYIHNIDENTSKIKIKYYKNNHITPQELELDYKREDFLPELWETRNPKNQTLLSGIEERDLIFDASVLEGNDIIPNQEGTIENIPLSDQDLNESSEPPNGFNAKFQTLNDIVKQIKPLYNDDAANYSKDYIETIIGAAIFYLPTSSEMHFSGYCTIKAINNCINGLRVVKDHITPRKYTANYLLNSSIQTTEELVKIYNEKFAQYMIVTSSENSQLVNYFKDHDSHDDALLSLGIEKFPPTEELKFISYKEFRGFINFIKNSELQELTMEIATAFLKLYRNK